MLLKYFYIFIFCSVRAFQRYIDNVNPTVVVLDMASKNKMCTSDFWTDSNEVCLIFPRASQLAVIGELQAREKFSASEYQNKASTEINNDTKRLNWSSFKEAPYRNPKPVNILKLKLIVKLRFILLLLTLFSFSIC